MYQLLLKKSCLGTFAYKYIKTYTALCSTFLSSSLPLVLIDIVIIPCSVDGCISPSLT